MIDPQRLSASDATPFEHRLLKAARNEAIPTEMKLRMSQGLNLGATALGGAGATSALSLNTLALIVLGTATILGLVAVVAKPAKEPSPPRSTVASPAAATIQETPSPEPPQPMRPAPAAIAATQEPSRAGTGNSPASTPRGREADLREEIALLDTARKALAVGAPRKAMGALDQYRRRYPNGTFVPESLALRIETLTLAGDRATAHTLARGFLKTYPDSPLAERVEQIARSAR
jgi:TolA-binding protein